MSAAPVPTTAPTERTDAEKLARMSQLWHWLAGLGVCHTCASTWAIAQVEKEAGAKWDPWPRKCKRRNRRDETCREAATAEWKRMPKPGDDPPTQKGDRP